MGVLIGNMVNSTTNNTLTLNYTNFPFYNVNIYNLDNDEVQTAEMKTAVTKPENGIIYTVSNVDGYSDAYILGLIFNSSILYSNNNDRFTWTNTNRAVINLNLSKDMNIFDNFTVTINTNDYTSVDNGTYGVIDSTVLKGTYTKKEDKSLEFESIYDFIELVVNETSGTFKTNINDYNTTNYWYTDNGVGGTIVGIIFNGAIYQSENGVIAKRIIDDLTVGTIIKNYSLYRGDIYNVVTINSDAEISVTNTEA